MDFGVVISSALVSLLEYVIPSRLKFPNKAFLQRRHQPYSQQLIHQLGGDLSEAIKDEGVNWLPDDGCKSRAQYVTRELQQRGRYDLWCSACHPIKTNKPPPPPPHIPNKARKRRESTVPA